VPIFFYHNTAQSLPRLGFGRVVAPPDIEKLNNTLRQRISRLVRKTLSLSKKLLAPYWANF
jgi:IS1 family transposase